MVGVDEVGRGCWAGPLLVVAARPTGKLPKGLKDSKVMTRKQREQILNLLSICCQFGEGWVSPEEIDEIGLSLALRAGAAKALQKLNAAEEEKIILDGKFNYIEAKYSSVTCMVEADAKIPLVSAAGIYAKVQRDNFMQNLKKSHPFYGFEKHVGYGTKFHRQAVEKYGVIKGIHRFSFKPINQLSLWQKQPI